MARKSLDEIELFLEHGVHLPSRTIKLDLEEDSPDDGGPAIGIRTASKFIKNLIVLETINSDPITIVINSAGGSVDDGWAIYDAIRSAKSKTIIKVLGQCSSMALVILQAATERVGYPWSRYMGHDGSVGIHANARDVEAYVEFAKIDRYRVYEVFAQRTGKPKSYWNRRFAKDYYMSAEQALAEGLIDRIAGHDGE